MVVAGQELRDLWLGGRALVLTLALSLLLLLALFAPTQFPTGAQQGWAGDVLLRVNPLTAGEPFIGKIVINGHSWSHDASC